MSKKLRTIRCINPLHNDSTPSMAVYDSGGDKLQVYCFGCHYHGWVTQGDIPAPITQANPATYVDNREWLPFSQCTFSHTVMKFFEERNIDVYKLSGLENTEDFNFTIRWSIYELTHHSSLVYVCDQERYLASSFRCGRPKTKYTNIKNKITTGSKLYTSSIFDDTSTQGTVLLGEYKLLIAESIIDAVFLEQKFGKHGVIVVSALGTPTDWDLYKYARWLKSFDSIHLFFDGDNPGIASCYSLRKHLESLGCDEVTSHCVADKVYNSYAQI